MARVCIRKARYLLPSLAGLLTLTAAMTGGMTERAAAQEADVCLLVPDFNLPLPFGVLPLGNVTTQTNTQNANGAGSFACGPEANAQSPNGAGATAVGANTDAVGGNN